MTEFFKIAIAVIIICIIISALKDIKKEYAIYISVACGALILVANVSELRYIKEIFEELIDLSDMSISTLKIFFKAVGITVISSLASDVCMDSGNRFLASCVELSGKIAVTVLALPLINAVIKIIAEYIGN